MSEVDNNSSINTAPVSSLQVSQLESLETELNGKLEQRRKTLSKTGIVADIHIADDTQVQTIQKALTKVREARSQVDPRVTNYLAGVGQFGAVQAKPHDELSIDSVNAKEVAQVKAIRSISGMTLARGQQFASLNGKEPSYNHYMEKNIRDLFALTALRA